MLLLICKQRSPIKYLAFGYKELARVFLTINKVSFIFQKAGSCNVSWGCDRGLWPGRATSPVQTSGFGTQRHKRSLRNVCDPPN